jgi:hypothetical protein
MSRSPQRRVSHALATAARARQVPGQRSVLRYPGLALARHPGGDQVEKMRIPVGAQPTEADDEALIAALREALLWSGTAHSR